MATLQTNAFTSYKLEEGEALAGQVLNLSQKIVIQNRLSIIAHQQLNTVVDTKDVENFIQQNAYWKGQLELLQALLEDSDIAEQALKLAATQS